MKGSAWTACGGGPRTHLVKRGFKVMSHMRLRKPLICHHDVDPYQVGTDPVPTSFEELFQTTLALDGPNCNLPRQASSGMQSTRQSHDRESVKLAGCHAEMCNGVTAQGVENFLKIERHRIRSTLLVTLEGSGLRRLLVKTPAPIPTCCQPGSAYSPILLYNMYSPAA